MEGLCIKPLDGADGYLRWKESVLLGLHSVGVAHVLSNDPPPAPARAGGGDGDGAQAANKLARDDALCRGHILAALSDHLLPVYIRHATGRALWKAVARTYEPDASSWRLRFEELEFGEDETILERVASAEALAIAGNPKISDKLLACTVCTKHPKDVAFRAMKEGDENCMDRVWMVAQREQMLNNAMQILVAREEKENRISSKSNGNLGHIAKRRR